MSARRRWPAPIAVAILLVLGIAVIPGTPALAAPPVVDYPLPASTVPGNDFTASGTSDENAPIEISMNAGPVICTIPGQPGTWSWSCDITGLSGGAQTLHVVQNAVDYPVSFTLEGAPLVIGFPADGQDLYGPISEVRGTGDSGDSILVDLDGGSWCIEGPPATPGDAWNCVGAPEATPGLHTVDVYQGTKSVSHTFTINTVLPAPATTTDGGGTVERTPDAMPSGLLTVSGTATYYTEEPVQLTSTLLPAPASPPLQSCITTPAPDGSWSCTFPLPVALGSYVLGVSQWLSTTGATDGPEVALLVLPAPAPPPPPPAPVIRPAPAPLLAMDWALSITDASGAILDAGALQPGQAILVRGAGLPPGASASIELHSDPVLLGQASAGADGAFVLAATVPEDAPSGAHTLVASASAPGYLDSTVSQAVMIAPPPAEPEPEETARVDLPNREDPARLALARARVGGGGFDDPTVFGTSMRTVQELRLDPLALAVAGGLVAGVLLLIALPSVLLDSTLRENYERVFRWPEPIRRFTKRVKERLWGSGLARWTTAIVLMLASSVITGFADPDFGATPASLRLFIALTLSLLVLNVTISVVVARVAKRSLGAVSALRLRPAGLIVLALGVLISRLADVHPGLIFGAFVGLALVTGLDRSGLAAYTLLGAGITTALGLISWLGYSLIAPLAAAHPGFGLLLLQEVLAATGAESLIVFVVLMLPFSFLDGKAVWDRSKGLWAVSYAVVLAIFGLLLLPMPETWVEATVPGAVLAAIFGAFGLVSIGIWAWFRLRRPPAP